MRCPLPPRSFPTPPPHLTSRYDLRVRFVETDLMGIVHHGTYLTYFEAGRVDWLHRRGISYDQWVAQGIHLPVVETNLRYRKAARFDDRLVVASTCSVVTRVTVRFDYRVLRPTPGDPANEEVLCEGFTLLACVGDDMTPKRLPPLVAETFARAECPPSEWT